MTSTTSPTAEAPPRRPLLGELAITPPEHEAEAVIERVAQWTSALKPWDVYECWLLNDQYGKDNPAVMVCTRLPAGVKVAESVSGEVRVAFVGYFFKRLRYRPADARSENEFRDVPYLVGRLLPPPRKAGASAAAWTEMLLPLWLDLFGLFGNPNFGFKVVRG